MMTVFFYQLDAQILYFYTFSIFQYMFRALLCSSSGGQIVLVQHLVSSLKVTVQYTGYERIPLVTCALNSHLQSVMIPDVL